MEVAIIDWKSIDSRFVKDELYGHIDAPKWVNFDPPDDPVDDEAWFCRSGCDHPKTVEDFFSEKQRTPSSNSKLQRSASVSDIPPFPDGNKRDATLKKRGVNHQPFASSNKDGKYNRVNEDGENQDPNFSTPPNHKARFGKEAFKSSAEKNSDTNFKMAQTPKLKSTLSARNLFSGGDILSKVNEFCNELKKMATRRWDKENGENVNVEKQEGGDHVDDDNTADLNDKQKERKPLLELSKEKSEVIGASGSKGQLRRKKIIDDAENTPISLDVKNIKGQDEKGLLQIRTCPPTPQCFSATQRTLNSTTSSPERTRPPIESHEVRNPERVILQELKPINKKNDGGGEVVAKDAKALDVFWFLKPCTLSS